MSEVALQSFLDFGTDNEFGFFWKKKDQGTNFPNKEYKSLFQPYSGNSPENQNHLDRTESYSESTQILSELLRKQELKNQFFEELKLNPTYFNWDHEKLVSIFLQITDFIIKINYEKISIECTPDSSVFFNILFMDNIKIHIEYYIEEDLNSSFKMFFNVFKEKKSMKTGYGVINNIINELTEYCK